MKESERERESEREIEKRAHLLAQLPSLHDAHGLHVHVHIVGQKRHTSVTKRDTPSAVPDAETNTTPTFKSNAARANHQDCLQGELVYEHERSSDSGARARDRPPIPPHKPNNKPTKNRKKQLRPTNQ